MTAETKYEPSHVSVRTKISALWTAMLFVFAYVDIFSLYRPDFRAELEAGEVGGFTVDQAFLLGTTVYVLIPSLMVFGTLVLRPAVDRIANIALGVLYALTIVAGAIGEWNYYVLGSAIEVALLGAVVYYASTWPKSAPPSSTSG
jgi:cbb3-type cytochrome oxidase subunit 3